VVEVSLGVPTGGVENGFRAPMNHLVGDVWGMELELLGATRHERGPLVGICSLHFP
jgi:hypothetical protein